MPYGYGFSQQRRPSANYTPPSYGGETVLAEVLNRINGQIDDYQFRKEEEKARQKAEELELQKVGGQVQMAGMLASADVDRSIATTQEQQRKQAVIDELSKRYAAGDRTVAARLIQEGVPVGALKAMEAPKPELSLEEQAYQRRRGQQRADKEMGAGSFAPRRAGAPKPVGPMSMTEATRQARAGVQTYVAEAMEGIAGRVNGSPEAAVIQRIVMDPAYAEMTQDPNFIRSVRSEAAAAVRKAQAEKAKAGAKQGATASSFAKADSILNATRPR